MTESERTEQRKIPDFGNFSLFFCMRWKCFFGQSEQSDGNTAEYRYVGAFALPISPRLYVNFDTVFEKTFRRLRKKPKRH